MHQTARLGALRQQLDSPYLSVSYLPVSLTVIPPPHGGDYPVEDDESGYMQSLEREYLIALIAALTVANDMRNFAEYLRAEKELRAQGIE